MKADGPMGNGADAEDASGDLPDFDSFLTQIGYGHYFRLAGKESVGVSGGGCADEKEAFLGERVSAPSLRRAPRVRPHVAHALTGAALIVGAVLLVAAWPSIRQGLDRVSSQWSEAGGEGFVAAPFFTLDGFRAIEPGMDAARVRNLVGPPLARRFVRGQANEQNWTYTTPTTGGDREVPLCVVTLRDGRVARTDRIDARNVTGFGHSWLKSPVQDTNRLWLLADNGDRNELRASAVTAVVLADPRVPNDWRPPKDPRVRLHRIAALGAAKASEPHLRRVVLPKGKLRLNPSPLAVYWRGRLYALPTLEPGADPEILNADLDWVLRHLR